jgi:predicted aminopeptidase
MVLKLPDNGSYTSYVELERPGGVECLRAEFSLQLHEWCFPVVGCVRYRGYFRESAARDYANGLAAAGYDTSVGGAVAYSTLGWFDDPVFSTLIGFSDARLAGVIFHELAHQQLYIEDDTAFNEGFAMTVEFEGVGVWMKSNGNARRPGILPFLGRQEDSRLVMRTRDQLQALYGSEATAEEKRREKQRLLAAMRAAYENLRRSWGGYDGYDAWFADGLNNAKLAAVITYRDYVPLFRQLFRQTGGDFAAFYRAAAAIGALPKAQRRERVRAGFLRSRVMQNRARRVVRDESAGP